MQAYVHTCTTTYMYLVKWSCCQVNVTVLIVQWLSHMTSCHEDMGLIPAGDSLFLFSCEVCVECPFTQFTVSD